MLLWHGTTMSCARSIVTMGPDLSRSRRSLDFGAGFYVTTRQTRAVEWALVAADRLGEPPAVLCWEVGCDAFASAPKLAFAEAGRSADAFWDFVRFNRRVRQAHRKPPLGYFDIVIGPASQDHRSKIAIRDMDQVSFHTESGLALLNSDVCAIYEVRDRKPVQLSRP